MRTAYLFSADLPNRRAHVVQMMKNAQAWARQTEDFELILNTSWSAWRSLRPDSLLAAYGLEQKIPVTTYPLRHWETTEGHWLRFLFHQLASQRCARRQVDLLFTRTFFMARYAVAKGVRVMVETHGKPELSPDFHALLECVHHPLFAGLVTISDHLRDHYQELGIPGEKILVLPDGVDLAQFASPLERQQARHQLGLPVTGPIAGYVGHLYAGRGIEEIFYAAGKLPQVTFMLVGGFEGDLKKRQAEVAQLGLGNVLFTGFVENSRTQDYLWASDLLLMPYGRACPTAEWMSPLKMFEYMAAGRPIVATDLPALHTVLRHGDNSWMVPVDNGEALSAGIQHLLTHPELCTHLGQQALRDVIPYSWDNRVARIRAFLHERDQG